MSFTISINEEAAFEVLFAGPAGPTGPQGIQGIQGVPGQGLAAGGTTGQVLKKLSATSYDTGWLTLPSDFITSVTGPLAVASGNLSVNLSAYLPLAGGYITGDIQSLNGSEFRTFQSPNSAIIRPYQIQLGDAVGTLTVDAEGISFNSSPFKQTLPFLGLSGYATEAWVTSGFYPLASNPSGFLTASALTPYLLSATAATTYQTLAGMSAYLTKDGNLTGITNPAIARSNLDLGSGNGVTFASATIQGSGANVAQLSPTSLTLNHTSYGQFTIQPSSGITFPDATTQTTAYTGGGGTWGSIAGTLSNQADLQSALDAKLDQPTADGLYYPLAGNPANFIDSSALIGYATETFVTSQGYLTDAPTDGYTYGRLNGAWSAVASGGGVWGSITGTLGDQTDLATELGTKTTTNAVLNLISNLYTDISFGPTGGPNVPTGRLLIADCPIDGIGDSFARVNFSASAGFGSIVQDGDFGRDSPAGNFIYRNGGTTFTIASQTYVNAQGFITSSALTQYAPLAGATFTGAVGFNASTNFLGNVVVSMNSSNAALRINQRGTGNAITVEDSASPDATPFVVDQFGKVGVGVAPDATAAIKIDGNGMSFNGLVFNPTATAAHTGGANTLDLLVTINGVNYRLALRPA